MSDRVCIELPSLKALIYGPWTPKDEIYLCMPCNMIHLLPRFDKHRLYDQLRPSNAVQVLTCHDAACAAVKAQDLLNPAADL